MAEYFTECLHLLVLASESLRIEPAGRNWKTGWILLSYTLKIFEWSYPVI